MSHYFFGFIGTGNMAGALVRAACQKVDPREILLSNRTAAKAEALAAELGCVVGTNEEVAARCRYIFLGVKPQMMAGVLESLRPALALRKDRLILVSMAAGLTMDTISDMAGGAYPIIRIMPNTPCSVGAGMTTYTANSLVAEEELQEFLTAMEKSGTWDRLDEHLINAASAVAGCGGAFIWRSGLRPAPSEGPALRCQNGRGYRQADLGDRAPPRRPERPGLQSRRLHHRRCSGHGGAWCPWCRHGCRHRCRAPKWRAGQAISSPPHQNTQIPAGLKIIRRVFLLPVFREILQFPHHFSS